VISRRRWKLTNVTFVHSGWLTDVVSAQAGSLHAAFAMKAKRIVGNTPTSDVAKASAFSNDVLGLEAVMDLGWIRT
jgi:hypothetical protein